MTSKSLILLMYIVSSIVKRKITFVYNDELIKLEHEDEILFNVCCIFVYSNEMQQMTSKVRKHSKIERFVVMLMSIKNYTSRFLTVEDR